MKILHLTLKKKWFDMIASGEKTEEYRDIKPYWIKRFVNKNHTHILFRNGYASDAPKVLVELEYIKRAYGFADWGAPGVPVYVLMLGDIIDET